MKYYDNPTYNFEFPGLIERIAAYQEVEESEIRSLAYDFLQVCRLAIASEMPISILEIERWKPLEGTFFYRDPFYSIILIGPAAIEINTIKVNFNV